jgi:hypothetical protein
MALDPDSVRVDLLKVKRKIYTSFPEDSQAQKDFLLASKHAEIRYLSGLVASDMVDLVFGEYKNSLKFELLDIGVCLGIGLCFSVMLFAFHQAHPKNILLGFFMGWPLMVGFYFSSYHIWHIVDQWKKMKPFKKNVQEIKNKIEKLNGELGKIK